MSKSVKIRIIVILTAVFLLILYGAVYVLAYTPIEVPVDRIYTGYRLTYDEPYHMDSQPTASEPVTIQFSGTLHRYLIPRNLKENWENRDYFIGMLTVDGKMLEILENNPRYPSSAIRFEWGEKENVHDLFSGDQYYCRFVDHTGSEFHQINARFRENDPYIRIATSNEVIILPASTPEEAAQMYWDEEMHSWFET